jgi:ribosomal protein L32
MNNTFDESMHPRNRIGEFTDKSKIAGKGSIKSGRSMLGKMMTLSKKSKTYELLQKFHFIPRESGLERNINKISAKDIFQSGKDWFDIREKYNTSHYGDLTIMPSNYRPNTIIKEEDGNTLNYSAAQRDGHGIVAKDRRAYLKNYENDDYALRMPSYTNIKRFEKNESLSHSFNVPVEFIDKKKGISNNTYVKCVKDKIGNFYCYPTKAGGSADKVAVSVENVLNGKSPNLGLPPIKNDILNARKNALKTKTFHTNGKSSFITRFGRDIKAKVCYVSIASQKKTDTHPTIKHYGYKNVSTQSAKRVEEAVKTGKDIGQTYNKELKLNPDTKPIKTKVTVCGKCGEYKVVKHICNPKYIFERNQKINTVVNQKMQNLRKLSNQLYR